MSGDCLVFRIVEKDASPQLEDMDIFILYDSYHSLYLLRGKRSDTTRLAMKDYSFESYSSESVIQFVSLVIPKDHKCTFELYSYPDLPRNKDDITFNLLRTTMDPATEVVAYNNQELCNKQIRKILSTITDITNNYEPDELSRYSNEGADSNESDLEKWNAECSKRNEWQ